MSDFNLPITYVNSVDVTPLNGGLGVNLETLKKNQTMLLIVGAIVVGVLVWGFVTKWKFFGKAEEVAPASVRPASKYTRKWPPPSVTRKSPAAASPATASPAAASPVAASPAAASPAAASPAAASPVAASPAASVEVVKVSESAPAAVEPPSAVAAVEPSSAVASAPEAAASAPASSAPASAPEAAGEAAAPEPTLSTMSRTGRSRKSRSPAFNKLALYSKAPEEAVAAPPAEAAETSHDVMMRNYSFDKFRSAMMSGSPKSILLGEEEQDDAHWRATGHTRAAYERHVQPMNRQEEEASFEPTF